MVKPVPVIVPELMVTEAVPVDVRVIDCVAGEFRKTLPKPTLVALTLRVEVPTLNCKAKVLEIVPATAVSVTAWADVTEETVAVKAALVALAGTVTEDGTTTEVLLLERATLRPLLPAGAFSITVQASVPAPVKDPVTQESALNVPAAATPEPLILTTAVGLVEELLVMVSTPVKELTWGDVNVIVNVAL